MEPFLPPIASDPEFRPRIREGDLLNVPDPGAYRRILANPFPGVLALIAWCWTLHALFTGIWYADGHGPLIAILIIPFAGLIPWLFRYQCLDCGANGPLHRWKRHLCPPAARRILEGRHRPWRGPSPGLQVVFWLYVLGMALMAVRGLGPGGIVG
ncbi:hypothetical protein BH23PLA1_BH23PLA1_20180 [soil metagenome]